MTATAPVKTILVTGATDGIGRATALGLAERGAQVLVHGRRGDKVDQVCAEIARTAPNAPAAEGYLADLSSLAEVRALAEQVGAAHPRLDVLINNAGVFVKERQLSPDGFELTWAVNHLAPFLLTHLLLPALRAAPARVVTVSSVAHNRGQIHWDDLQLERGWDGPHPGPPLPGYPAYAQSKLANVMFSNELARRVEAEGVTSNSLHPGVIGTKLLEDGFGIQGGTTASGAETSIYLALSEDVAGVSGRYFSDCRETQTSPAAMNVTAQRRLWEISAEMTGLA
ncbi:SDR family NAD(P)-dependent oxidoreductase [Haliangium sp.]|uniref:SDR family NAD(P)-dependent oxidoreductase n=1 Tax=Haliangium sp. TaxID=2663208 RepID=UPI003D1218F7